MGNTSEAEPVYLYRDGESVGMTIIVACGMLSLLSVLGIFVILGLFVVRNRRSSDEKLFVRTHVAIYFFSLLICNLIQAIGALFNIAWIVEERVYTGTVCTAQAVIEQTASVGIAIFSFIIAAHNFTLLFFNRQWSERTSYIVLIVSWGMLVLDLCIGSFALADPRKGPYYGIAGYWCWITPKYPTEQVTTEILFIFISAGSSFILYLLVFFRLRGNIRVSGRHKIHFHQRPQIRVSRTIDGVYIVTEDRCVESHLMVLARQMLWHPIAYIVLVLPLTATRLSAFTGTPGSFPIIIISASTFVLTGFINAVLFCTTRNIPPGGWRKILSTGTIVSHGRVNVSSPSGIRRHTESSAGRGTVGTGRSPVAFKTSWEKDVEIEHNEAVPGPSSLEFGSPTSSTRPLRAYGSKQQAYSDSYHSRCLSYPFTLDERMSVRSEADRDGEVGDLDEGVFSANNTDEMGGTVVQHLVHTSRGRGSTLYEPAFGLEAPASVHPFAMAPPINTNTRRVRPSSILTFETAVNHTRFARVRGDFGRDGNSPHEAGYNLQPSQPHHTSVYPLGGDDHPDSTSWISTESRRPGY